MCARSRATIVAISNLQKILLTDRVGGFWICPEEGGEGSCGEVLWLVEDEIAGCCTEESCCNQDMWGCGVEELVYHMGEESEAAVHMGWRLGQSEPQEGECRVTHQSKSLSERVLCPGEPDENLPDGVMIRLIRYGRAAALPPSRLEAGQISHRLGRFWWTFRQASRGTTIPRQEDR